MSTISVDTTVNYYPRTRGRSPLGKQWNTLTGKWDNINNNQNTTSNISYNYTYFDNIKLSKLRKIAIKLGIKEKDLDIIDDSNNVRQRIINYILRNDTIINNNYIIFEGVQYLFDSITNEVCDINTFDFVGIYDNYSPIQWNNNDSKESHIENENNINNILL